MRYQRAVGIISLVFGILWLYLFFRNEDFIINSSWQLYIGAIFSGCWLIVSVQKKILMIFLKRSFTLNVCSIILFLIQIAVWSIWAAVHKWLDTWPVTINFSPASWLLIFSFMFAWFAVDCWDILE